MARDWSNIQRDVLEYIQTKLDLADVLRCRAVCREWQNLTRSHISSSLNSPLPKSLQQPLLLWDREHKSPEFCYSFLDVTRAGTNLYHPNPKSKQLLNGEWMCICLGYSHGWFLFLDDETDSRICMFHPLLFSAAAAMFPLISTPCGNRPRRIKRAVLWGDPVSATGGNYGIVVIHKLSKGCRHLLYAKCGSPRFIPLCNGSDAQYDMYDIISFNNYVYGITWADDNGNLRVVVWDFTGEEEDFVPRLVFDFQPEVKSTKNSLLIDHTYHYLMESEGELLIISIKNSDPKKMKSIKESERIGFSELYVHARSRDICRVWKMDFEEKKWVEMDSLGDRVLFITDYQTISLSTREFPQYQKNTIYFYHRINIEGCAPVVGVFNLEDSSMKEIEIKECKTSSQLSNEN